MAKFIKIDQIDVLEAAEFVAPLYVMVAGGMGAGKSFIMEKHVKSLTMVDIDEVMVKLGFTEYTPAQFAIAMKTVSEQMYRHMKKFTSVIAMGTASKLPTAINRLYDAKNKGYETVLVHVDTPIDQAVMQNRTRLVYGTHGVSDENEYKIRQTAIGAANTVATLRETNLVDYFVFYDNTRKDF